MKLGIISNYAEEDFRHVKDLGLEFIEICTNFDPESEEFIAKADETRRLIDKYELPVLSVGRWNANVIENNAINRDTVSLLKKEIDVAKEIGSPVFHLGVNRDREQSLFRNYVLAVEYLREMLDYAGERGVTLSLYNCDWGNFLCCDKAWDIVLSEFPQLMIKYDCSHVYARGDDYIAELDKWADRVSHMHLKGALKVNGASVDDPPAGLDEFPWPRIFALLYMHGYDKTLSIEPHSGVWTGELGERGVKYTVEYMKKLILK